MSATKPDEKPGCLAWLLGIGRKPSLVEERGMRPVALAYQRLNSVLSANELTFYHSLLNAVEGEGRRFVVLIKVKLSDLYEVKPGNRSQYQADKNRVNSRHVDFLVCEKETLTPAFAIELDDRSHIREDRIESDNFKNELFATTGLKLIRFQTERTYDPERIAETIRRYLNQ